MYEGVQIFHASGNSSDEAYNKVMRQIDDWQEKMGDSLTLLSASPALAASDNWTELCITVLFHTGRASIQDEWITAGIQLLKEGPISPQDFMDTFEIDTETTNETALQVAKMLLDTGFMTLNNGLYMLNEAKSPESGKE